MEGKIDTIQPPAVSPPAIHIATIRMTPRERQLLTLFFYHWKDSQVTIAGISSQDLSELNNLAMPMWHTFEEGYTE